jgi:cell division protein FtsW
MKRDLLDEGSDWSVPRVLAYAVSALVAIGVVILASASSVRGQVLAGDPHFFLKRQLVWLVVGVMGAWVTVRFDYERWRRLATPLMVLTLFLMVLVVILGPKIGGSRRWLHVAGVGMQPSELAKFAVVLFVADRIARVPLRTGRIREGLVLPGAALAAVVLLTLLEPDVGTALLIGAVGWLVLVVSGSRLWLLVLGGLAGLLSIGTYVRTNPVRWLRIKAWMWPEQYPDTAYHFLESQKAFVLGGAGIHPGGSIQKHFYLPEAHTDFIYAILGEEFGIWGTAAVMILFVVILVCGVLVSLRARDVFGRLLAFGITLTLTLQAAINIAVVTGAMPTKGLPLPFFSYGGSSLVMSLFQVGVLLNIGLQVSDESRQPRIWIRDRVHRP